MTKNDDTIFDESEANNRKVQALVFYYNVFAHHGIKMISPVEMRLDINKEWLYIRRKKELLEDQKLKQMKAGMWSYKKGQSLRMYLDPDKTKNKFDKDRHSFKTYGEFVEYRHGNVITKLKDDKKVEVPIYYTIADNPNDEKIHKSAKRERDEKKKSIKALKDEIEGFEK